MTVTANCRRNFDSKTTVFSIIGNLPYIYLFWVKYYPIFQIY
jgi:hypothetical protein